MDDALCEGHTIDELLLVLFRLIALFQLIILSLFTVSNSKVFSYGLNLDGGISE